MSITLQSRRPDAGPRRPPPTDEAVTGAPAGLPAFAEPVQKQNLEGGEPPTPGPRAKPTTEKRGASVHAAADRGLAGAAEPVPHRERMQEAFGRHDISRVKARVGGAAGEAAASMDARAFTRGNQIGFRSAPEPELVAHELTHVVQQQGGVQLEGGVGRPGDPYERQADEVADAVARGESAEAILDRDPTGGGEPAGVQAKCATCGGAMEDEAPVQAQCASCAAEEADAPVQMELAVTGRSALLDGDEEAGGEAEGEPEPEAETAREQGEGEEDAEAETETDAETEAETEPEGGEVAEVAEAAEATDDAEGEPPGAPAAGGAAPTPETEPEPETPTEPETAPAPEPAAGPPALDSPDAPVQMAPARTREKAQSCSVIDHPVEKPPEGKKKDEKPKEPPGGGVDEKVTAKKDEGNPADDQPCEDIAAEGEQATAQTEGQADAAATEGGEPGAAVEEAVETAAPEGGAAPEGAGGGGGDGAGDAVMATRIADAEAARAESVAVSETAAAEVETAAAAPGDIRALTVTFAGSDEARAPAEAALTDFFTGTAARLDEATAFARDGIPDRIGFATEAATAAIESEGARQRAAIEARIEAARAAIEAGALAASGRVDAAHATAIAHIEAATTGALEQVDTAYAEASARVPEMHEQMVGQLETTYRDAEKAYREVGRSRAATARETGASFAATYRSCKIHKSDGFWEGHLTDRRAEAAAKAAEQTAKGYADNFVKTANEQASKVGRGLPKDKHTARCTAEQIQQNLDTQYEQTVERIRAAHESAIAGADAQRDAAHAQIAAKRAESIAALDAQKPGQLRAVRQTTYMQIVAAEQLAHAAAGALQEGITSAANGLDEAMAALAESLQDTPAPTADGLATLLSGATARRDEAIANLQASTEEGLSEVDANLLAHTDTATSQLGDLGTSTAEQIAQLEQGSTQAIDGIAAGAEQGLAAHAERHAESVRGMADGIVESFKTLLTTLKTKYDELLGALKKTFGEATKSLEKSFDDALKGLSQKIPVEASDAASHEPPAWKTVVKWILVIAITIVIAFVAGPAAVGFLAGYGMSAFAAGVVAGAVLGAVAGGLNQVISNWETNRRWDEGLVGAIRMGALTGLAGGFAGGLVSGGISKALTEGMRRTVVDFAANIVLDAAMDLGFQLHASGWDFDKINWTDFAIGLGMSIAMNGVQARVQHTGGAGRPHADAPDGTAPRTHADAPDATAPKPHADAPDATAPKPHADAPDATAPKPHADAPDATAPKPHADAPDATAPKPHADADGTPPKPHADADGTPSKPAADAASADAKPKKGAFEKLADFQQKMYQRGERAGKNLKARRDARRARAQESGDTDTGNERTRATAEARDTRGYSGKASDAPDPNAPHLEHIARGTEVIDGVAPGSRAKLEELVQDSPQAQAHKRAIEDLKAEHADIHNQEAMWVDIDRRYAGDPQKIQQMHQERQRLTERAKQILETEIPARQKLYEDAQVQQFKRLVHEMDKVRKGLIGGDVEDIKSSQAQAKRYEISPEAAEKIKAAGSSVEEVQAQLAEFQRLTGRAPTPEEVIFVFSKGRAHYREKSRTGHGRAEINVGGGLSKETLFHEMAHHFEYADPKALEAVLAFMQARAKHATGNAGPHEPQSMKKLFPDDTDPYNRGEVGLPGDYTSTYTNRVYTHDGKPKSIRSTEVITTGVEVFATAERMAHLFRTDPEHFLLVLGILRSGGR